VKLNANIECHSKIVQPLISRLDGVLLGLVTATRMRETLGRPEAPRERQAAAGKNPQRL